MPTSALTPDCLGQARPNQLWVSNFAYVSTWRGWLYLAFVIDLFAQLIVGWRVSSLMRTDFVPDALKQASYDSPPERDGRLACHSDRGSQYVNIWYTERLSCHQKLRQTALGKSPVSLPRKRSDLNQATSSKIGPTDGHPQATTQRLYSCFLCRQQVS